MNMILKYISDNQSIIMIACNILTVFISVSSLLINLHNIKNQPKQTNKAKEFELVLQPIFLLIEPVLYSPSITMYKYESILNAALKIANEHKPYSYKYLSDLTRRIDELSEISFNNSFIAFCNNYSSEYDQCLKKLKQQSRPFYYKKYYKQYQSFFTFNLQYYVMLIINALKFTFIIVLITSAFILFVAYGLLLYVKIL